MDEITKLYHEYFELLDRQHFNVKELDYEILNHHIVFLKKMDSIDNSSISVFDLFKKQHVFVSENYSKMLGYDLSKAEEQGNSFFDSKVHPADFIHNLKLGIELIKLTLLVPVNERKDYKLVLDYRVLNGKGEYVRIIEQQQALELDRQGNVWLALSTVDFSPDQDLSAGPKSRLYNFKTGMIINSPVIHPDISKENMLSKREREVLKLVKGGMLSKEIAEKLFISVHTVNTHRQRILEKLNVDNSLEATQYASNLGLID